ncbi:serine hydrolase [Alkalibacillus haloalkaliphilus]|uniref:serine hydrolase n=1 Tax=Alkalibacillus haloalkaliphilus TaxID=94136 RepID=UPI0029362081|nr:serine hydrolase [Alkalibacillus haloalkaliphilus]MDV2581618.1 serine hydrolase [Alkalibacillus haloalkaliphilus]
MKQTKKIIMMLTMTAVFLFSSLVIAPMATFAEVNVEAESAILVDAETGDILYAKEADIALPPASMTKVMTEYLVSEAVANGEISWDTTTEISDYAYSISANNSFSGVGLRMDHEYTVKELYDAMAIYSDNATSIALAELVAGSEGEFVKMMNEKADEMGLPDAHFVNSTGLANSHLGDNYPEGTEPDDDNLLSARSMAILAYNLVNDYPDSLEVSSVPTQEFEGHEMLNFNWMLPGMPGHIAQYTYEGLDGLKTGYTELAGYTFTGTAERDGNRLISVVMRTDSVEERFSETEKLLDYGFDNFSKQVLFEEGYQVEDESTIPVVKGKENEVEIASGEAIEAMVRDGEEDLYSVTLQLDEEVLNEEGSLEAPVEEGLEVGQLVLTYEGDIDYGNLSSDEEAVEVPVYTTDEVERSNWFMLILQAIGDFFVGLFNSIKGIFT